METKLGIIGGSGLYDISGFSEVETLEISSPFGTTSSPLISGVLNGTKVVFLARHGAGHFQAPHQINYRANIDAMKRAGVTDIISISACGSLRENLKPGTFVLVNQFIDNTSGREKTFFDSGFVAHVSMAKPTCSRLADMLEKVMHAEDIPTHRGGTYVTIDGPQFSSYAESMMYRSFGADVIGMTNMPEAKLAREAEICYQTVAMVTDYDCWHEDFGHVDVASVLAVLHSNSAKAKHIIQAVTKKIDQERHLCGVGCDRALEMAIVTAKAAQSPEQLRKLDAIVGRLLEK